MWYIPTDFSLFFCTSYPELSRYTAFVSRCPLNPSVLGTVASEIFSKSEA